MLSSSARASRVCLSCRLAIKTASGRFAAKNLPRASMPPSRTYSSDGHRYSKEEFETLILGRSEKDKDKKSPQSSTKSKATLESHGGEDESSAAEKQQSEPIKMDDPGLQDAENDSVSSDSPNPAPVRRRERPARPFRHELLHHKNLAVDALGKPVEAIIIKNPNRMKRSAKQIPVMEEDQTSAPSTANLNWETLLRESEPSKDPTAEALENIEEMRPLNTKILSQREFDKLSSDLVEGFTQGQLAHYIAAKHSAPAPALDATIEYPWAGRFVAWEPMEVDSSSNIRPKTRLANAVLQKIWDIAIREQVEGLGRASLSMQPHIYHLLTKTSPHVIETMRNELLDNTKNEQIIAAQNDAQVTIHSRKSTVSIILSRLDEFAQAIASQEIPAGHIHRSNLTQAALDELGRVTDTALTHDANKKTVTVSWIVGADRPRPSDTDTDSSNTPEGPAGIVNRLLMVEQGDGPANVKLDIILPRSKAKGNSGQYVEHYREHRSMSWRDKLLKWFRYVAAAEKATADEPKPLKLASRLSLPQLPALQHDDQLSSVTYATFGHILHSDDRPSGETSRRILSPVVPHPAALTAIAADDEPIHQAAAIILNFSPAPTTASSSSAIPQVCLRLPIEPDTDLSSFRFPPTSTLHGIIPGPTNDILLPKESVDVRVTQQRLLPLDVHQPSLQEFLAASEFDLLQGRLRTPSKTTFTIPARWLSQPDSDAVSEIPYLFTGIEIHQTVEAAWQGHTIRYTSIEAGQHGGQRQELSLHPANEWNEESFLQAVEDVATGKLFSWSEGYKLMRTPEDGGGYAADLMDGGRAAYKEEDLVEALPSAVPRETVGEEAGVRGEEDGDSAGEESTQGVVDVEDSDQGIKSGRTDQ